MARFDARDRADGTVLGTFEIGDAAAVRAAVDIARTASLAAARNPLSQRVRLLRAWRGRLWRSSGELATLLHRESGLGLDEAMTEVLLTVEHLRWLEGNAARVLGSVTQRGGLLSPELTRRTSYVPLGVVGVDASAYAPLYGAASAVATALVSGNAVILRPAPAITATLVELVAMIASTTPLVQVVTGDDSTTAALASAPIDRLCLFGSPAGTSRTASACARAMVPVTVVPVGPPVTVVAPDADLSRAAAAVARTVNRVDDPSAGLPEVYVAPVVGDDFAQALRVALEAADGGGRTLGVGRGAVARALGPLAPRRARRGPLALAGGGEPWDRRLVVQCEAELGDVLDRLAQRPFAHVAVFSRARGQRIAEALNTAHVSINVGSGSQADGVPRSALGAQGYGPLAGEDGVRTFTRAVTTTSRRRLPLPVPTGPADALLATPPGRVAARLALHLRHSL